MPLLFLVTSYKSQITCIKLQVSCHLVNLEAKKKSFRL